MMGNVVLKQCCNTQNCNSNTRQESITRPLNDIVVFDFLDCFHGVFSFDPLFNTLRKRAWLRGFRH